MKQLYTQRFLFKENRHLFFLLFLFFTVHSVYGQTHFILGGGSGVGFNTPYSLRYTDVVKGGVIVAGNTNITRNGTAPVSRQVDIDGDATTFNSSSEEIVLPAGATVKKAYLYWQSTCYSSGAVYNISSLPVGRQNFTHVKLKTPGNGYIDIVPDTAWQSSYYYWQGMKVVTNEVQQAGSGVYTVGNIDSDPTPPGTNNWAPYGGWSLWIEYEDPSGDWVSITLTDGLTFVSAGNNAINVTGFEMPATGVPIKGEAGWFIGHANLEWGDALTYSRPAYPGYPVVNGQFITDASNPANNPLNESRSYKGSAVTHFRNPSSNFSYGYGTAASAVGMPWFDLDVIDLSPLLVPGQTEFTLRFYPQGNGAPGGCGFPGGCDDWDHPGYIYTAVNVVQPLANKDTSAGNTPGLPVAIDILANDVIANGLAPGAADVIIDLDLASPGSQSFWAMPEEGEWNYDNITGILTFAPEPDFMGVPTSVQYQMTEIANGLWSYATVTILMKPEAINDQAANIPGQPVSIPILANDTLSDGQVSTPEMVIIDIDLATPGLQTNFTVTGEGEWTYDPITGMLLFEPEPGFNDPPTAITYTLTEAATGLVADASASVTLAVQPTAADDVSSGNTPGSPVSIPILNNDLAADGSPADPLNVLVDIDPSTVGDQSELVVPGEGTWSYEDANGELVFAPLPGFTNVPSAIEYILREASLPPATASVSILFTPVANTDNSAGNTAAQPVAVNILDNDVLSNGVTPVPADIAIDLDPDTSGDQDALTVSGEGIWSYTNGVLTFTPESGFFEDPSSINYSFTEKATGMSATATVAIGFIVLPVELVAFNAKQEESIVSLSWITAQELNSSYFEIQRSQDAESWIVIGKVAAKGESAVASYYFFKDKDPDSYGKNYYRLKMVDQDASVKYSLVRHVDSGSPATQVILFPIPARETIKIKVTGTARVSNIRLYDVHGKRLYDAGGEIKDEIDVRPFAPGAYLLRVIFSNGSTNTYKIMIADR